MLFLSGCYSCVCTVNTGSFIFCSCRDSNRSVDIFDEKKHPLSVSLGVSLHEVAALTVLSVADSITVVTPSARQRDKVPDDYSVVDPEHKLIYRFIRTLFSSAQLTAECAIVTLVSSQQRVETLVCVCVCLV